MVVFYVSSLEPSGFLIRELVGYNTSCAVSIRIPKDLWELTKKHPVIKMLSLLCMKVHVKYEWYNLLVHPSERCRRMTLHMTLFFFCWNVTFKVLLMLFHYIFAILLLILFVRKIIYNCVTNIIKIVQISWVLCWNYVGVINYSVQTENSLHMYPRIDQIVWGIVLRFLWIWLFLLTEMSLTFFNKTLVK
jgi:hypothetical protein